MTYKTFFIVVITLIHTCYCDDVKNLFEKINRETIKLNAIGADVGWQSLINPSSPDLPDRAGKFQKSLINWKQSNCNKLATLYFANQLNSTQKRQTYLLCRGLKYSYKETRKTSNLYEEIQAIYNDAETCIPNISKNSSLVQFEEAILNYVSKVNTNLNSEQLNKKLNTEWEGNQKCLIGEKEFDSMMKYSKNETVLRWVWSEWREKMIVMKTPYLQMMKIENKAAKRNGYKDIGAFWRDEIELPDLRRLCYQLYESILPLYKLLHGVARFQLRKNYGDIVPEKGPIPAHLLGDLWSQNWEKLVDMILPQNINLDHRINKLNWTVDHMVKRAEDFYTSLGLPAMTQTFWRESIFTQKNNSIRCHGTAADMFKNGDYRLLYCSNTSFEDFYVLHHEMGHIQYYMAYEKQPGLFRQANIALHEAIGDTIMLGAVTPQHLHRLGLINDTELFANDSDYDNMSLKEIKYDKSTKELDTNTISVIDIGKTFKLVINAKKGDLGKMIPNLKDNIVFKDKGNAKGGNSKEHKADKLKKAESNHISTDDVLILKQALNKLPQIPFSLVLDEYRWRLFEGNLDKRYLNKEFWKLARELQGIAPVGYRGEGYFDVGAKYHVADNVSYIRYFLSSFVQYQLFERLCKAAVFGRKNVAESMPSSIALHRCDIYGSKVAGKILNDLMSRGSSQHWMEILQESADIGTITSSSLINYYRPVYKMLAQFVKKHNIPIGW
ncbi:angiotensin-converting enzyme-related protein-like [Zerene cesonia]|uniref:angiotensin-converting enzyme-related protein-like n=1 Tax=Zerene cesonia TaxID=33412 RepID=UPI0018E51C1D|nr:angiotensin-converting enzyme-related protein-like [Zerene cesonia]